MTNATTAKCSTTVVLVYRIECSLQILSRCSQLTYTLSTTIHAKLQCVSKVQWATCVVRQHQSPQVDMQLYIHASCAQQRQSMARFCRYLHMAPIGPTTNFSRICETRTRVKRSRWRIATRLHTGQWVPAFDWDCAHLVLARLQDGLRPTHVVAHNDHANVEEAEADGKRQTQSLEPVSKHMCDFGG